MGLFWSQSKGDLSTGLLQSGQRLTHKVYELWEKEPFGARKGFLKTFSVGCVSLERSGLGGTFISHRRLAENFSSALVAAAGASRTSWASSRPHLCLKGCKRVPGALGLPAPVGELGGGGGGCSQPLWA